MIRRFALTTALLPLLAAPARGGEAASPFALAARLEARMASGAGVLLPDAERELSRFAGTVDLARGDWPAAFLARAGETIGVAVSPFTGNYEFFDESGECFFTLVPVLPTTDNWVAPFRHAEEGAHPDDALYAPWRLVDVWFLSHAESPEFSAKGHASNAPNLKLANLRTFEPETTNLCFTAFSFTETNLFFTAAWPTNEPLPESTLDLYGSTNLLSSHWTLLSSFPATNQPVSFVINPATFPWSANPTQHDHNAACVSITNIVASPLDGTTVYTNIFWSCSTNRMPEKSGFFRLGTRLDSDGDGLPDAYERLCLGSDPIDALDAYADSDGDGLPNVYEFIHGTDPLVPDWEAAPKFSVGGAGSRYRTLKEAFQHCAPYEILVVEPGIRSGPDWTDLEAPSHPFLLSSPDGGTRRGVVLRAGNELSVLRIDSGAGRHVVVQGIAVDLSATASWQAAFFWGGLYPYSGEGAGGCFRNVEVRFGSGSGTAIGWQFRHFSTEPVLLSGCVANAEGRTNARGVYAIDSPPLFLENCSFREFPDANAGPGYAIQLESTVSNPSSAPATIPVSLSGCLFDASFTNALVLAPLTNGVRYATAMDRCLFPVSLEYPADEEAGTVVVPVSIGPHGHLSAGSPAIGVGPEPRLSSVDIDGEPRGTPSCIGADEWSDGSAVDSDGDGLSNGDELFILGTDPFDPDTDGDSVPDLAEIAEGTDPVDRGSVCFFLSGCLDTCLTETNQVVLAIASGDAGPLRLLASVRPSAPPAFSFSFPHVALTNEPAPRLCLFVDADGDGLPGGGESAEFVPLVLSGHESVVCPVFRSVSDDQDGDDLPDLWEFAHGLCSTNALDACFDPDGDGLINLHEYWHDYDPWVADGSNTVLSILARSVDDRIAGKNPTNSLKFFSGYPGNTSGGATNALVANPSCWAADLDFSCESPWNSNARNRKSGTLISPSHILLAHHHISNSLPLGTKFWFRSQDGEIFTRFLTATNRIVSVPDTDWVVGLLDEPLPSSVKPAKILPPDFYDYTGSGKRLPCASLDQEGKVLVAEINKLEPLPQGGSRDPFQISASLSSLESRRSFFEILTVGDSSNPKFLLFGDQPILLSIHWYANHSGTSVRHSVALLESAMEELSPDGDWRIPCVDFSGFPTIGGVE